MDKSIEQNLQAMIDQSNETPCVVIRSGEFVGNQTGYLALALAAIRASGGERIEFEKEDWSSVEDLDYAIGEFKYDASAHIYKPAQSRFSRGVSNLFGVAFVLGILVLSLLGLVEVVHILHRLA